MALTKQQWDELFRLVRAVLEAETDDFNEVVRIAGLDPATDLRHGDWSGTNMRGCDLRGFDFRGSAFVEVDVAGADLDGARFDGADCRGTDFRTIRPSVAPSEAKPDLSGPATATDTERCVPVAKRGVAVRPVPGRSPPRVQLTYNVRAGGRVEQKQLPFVLGVMGDYAGQPAEPLPRLEDRKFVDIHKGNFDAVMKRMRPRLAYRVDNKLAKDGTQLPVELTFESMADFDPEQVARKVEPLRKLVEMRQRLAELEAKLASDRDLRERFEAVTRDPDLRERLEASTRGGTNSSRADRDPAGRAEPTHDQTVGATPQPDEPVPDRPRGGTPLRVPGRTTVRTDHTGRAVEEIEIVEVFEAINEDIDASRTARGRRPRMDVERERARDLISELVNQLLDGNIEVLGDLVSAIKTRIAEIDRLLSEQLSAVMHAPEFQRLEASWRGLYYLVARSPLDETVIVRVLNVSKVELLRDFRDAWDLRPCGRI